METEPDEKLVVALAGLEGLGIERKTEFRFWHFQAGATYVAPAVFLNPHKPSPLFPCLALHLDYFTKNILFMKHILLFVLLGVSAFQLSAQIQKGSILVGGTAGINTVSAEGTTITAVNLSPQAGFFLSDRFALGGSVSLALLAGEGASIFSVGIGPFARYYFNNSGSARFFGQADLAFEIPDLEESDPRGGFGLGIGADFFLNEHVAIEGFLGYERIQVFEAESGLNLIGLNFGFAAFLGGKKDK